MSPRAMLAGGIGLAALAAAAIWASLPARPDWSTGNAAALVAFLEGREATAKMYHLEAVDRFREAVEQDPGFFAARLMLADALSSAGQRDAARAERQRALAHDPLTLTARERRMLEIAKARSQGDPEALQELLVRLAEAHPDDAEVTRALAQSYMNRGELETAIRWCDVTLAQAPNDALVYNMLGYIEMTRGRFAASEGHFRRYAFIAPDQANPHDSLSELYVLTGRLDDAETELRRALALNPRFYPAWQHLAGLEALRGNARAALEACERWFELAGLSPDEQWRERVSTRASAALFAGDDEALIAAARELEGRERGVSDRLVVAAAAAVARRPETARRVVEELERVEAARKDESWKGAQTAAHPGPRSLLVRAFAALAEGRPLDAAVAAEAADRSLTFGPGEGPLKLLARLTRARALLEAGDRLAARDVARQIAEVNPSYPGLARLQPALEGR